MPQSCIELKVRFTGEISKAWHTVRLSLRQYDAKAIYQRISSMALLNRDKRLENPLISSFRQDFRFSHKKLEPRKFQIRSDKTNKDKSPVRGQQAMSGGFCYHAS
jgi:hypothetical protein